MSPESPLALVENLWDARDVAHFLRVSRSWVYQKAEARLLPCLRIGGLLRFDPATVRAWACGAIAVQPTPESILEH